MENVRLGDVIDIHPPARRWRRMQYTAITAVVGVATIGACFWIARADPETLVQLSRGLMAAGLLGLVVIGGFAISLLRVDRGRGGGGGIDGPEPNPTPLSGDLDAELDRLIEEERRKLGIPR